MPRGMSADKVAQQEAAFAAITEVLPEVIGRIATSRAQGQAYEAEAAEIEETIQRLQARRRELRQLSAAHVHDHATVRHDGYVHVYSLCQAATLSPNRMLQIAAQLELEASDVLGALELGRQLLRTLDDEPILARGYVYLATQGLWYGGRTRGAPHVELVGTKIGRFAIAIPVVADSERDVCRVPVDSLSRKVGDTRDLAQVYIGVEQITAMLQARLAGRQDDDGEVAQIKACLQSAGLDTNLANPAGGHDTANE